MGVTILELETDFKKLCFYFESYIKKNKYNSFDLKKETIEYFYGLV